MFANVVFRASCSRNRWENSFMYVSTNTKAPLTCDHPHHWNNLVPTNIFLSCRFFINLLAFDAINCDYRDHVPTKFRKLYRPIYNKIFLKTTRKFRLQNVESDHYFFSAVVRMSSINIHSVDCERGALSVDNSLKNFWYKYLGNCLFSGVFFVS